jgi:hypothetical protein
MQTTQIDWRTSWRRRFQVGIVAGIRAMASHLKDPYLKNKGDRTDNVVSVIEPGSPGRGRLLSLSSSWGKPPAFFKTASGFRFKLIFSSADLRSVVSKGRRSWKNGGFSGENWRAFFGRFQLRSFGRRFSAGLPWALASRFGFAAVGGKTGRPCVLFPNPVLRRPLELAVFCVDSRSRVRGRFSLRAGRVLKTVASLQTFIRCALF